MLRLARTMIDGFWPVVPVGSWFRKRTQENYQCPYATASNGRARDGRPPQPGLPLLAGSTYWETLPHCRRRMASINFQRLLWGALAQPSLPAMKRRGLIYLREGPVSAASSTVNIKVVTCFNDEHSMFNGHQDSPRTRKFNYCGRLIEGECRHRHVNDKSQPALPSA
jgi:hypothetical protein